MGRYWLFAAALKSSEAPVAAVEITTMENVLFVTTGVVPLVCIVIGSVSAARFVVELIVTTPVFELIA
jgi:hypothetical protein